MLAIIIAVVVIALLTAAVVLALYGRLTRHVNEDRHAMRADKFCWTLDAQRSGTDDRREEAE